ncbi:MAG: RNA polymerase sporulation sigma factor SigK [Lachnospiraceae bacterium]|nr:RNA polymerase sporulation sigma factor SigK [Lachnospiraceae bacterium]
MKTFQQPLPGPEERRYLEELKGDDPAAAKEAKRILIEHNLRLVAHIAKKYQNADEDMEDLISVGTIGLIKAIDSYDPDKGSKLVTYASRCIDNELLMLMRGRKKIAKEVSLYEPIGMDKEGNEISFLDICVYGKEDLAKQDFAGQLELNYVLGRLSGLVQEVLTDREKEIIILRYGLSGCPEMTQREIGKKLGISRSYVSRIEKRALEKLKRAMKEFEK